jgi:hypothetical protein
VTTPGAAGSVNAGRLPAGNRMASTRWMYSLRLMYSLFTVSQTPSPFDLSSIGSSSDDLRDSPARCRRSLAASRGSARRLRTVRLSTRYEDWVLLPIPFSSVRKPSRARSAIRCWGNLHSEVGLQRFRHQAIYPRSSPCYSSPRMRRWGCPAKPKRAARNAPASRIGSGCRRIGTIALQAPVG